MGGEVSVLILTGGEVVRWPLGEAFAAHTLFSPKWSHSVCRLL